MFGWALVVFLMGIVGLIHETTMITRGIPIFGQATSVVLMLVALGMCYTAHRRDKENSEE